MCVCVCVRVCVCECSRYSACVVVTIRHRDHILPLVAHVASHRLFTYRSSGGERESSLHEIDKTKGGLTIRPDTSSAQRNIFPEGLPRIIPAAADPAAPRVLPSPLPMELVKAYEYVDCLENLSTGTSQGNESMNQLKLMINEKKGIKIEIK